MKSHFLIISIFTAFFSLISCRNNKASNEISGTIYKLYFAGGQSNMEGFGYTTDLPEEYKDIDSEIMIFNGSQAPDDCIGGGSGKWLSLSSGFGTGYKSTNEAVCLSDRFGPELSFGKRISELTNEKIAIIKYARDGSSIALGASKFGTWEKDYNESTTINQWDHFENTVKNAFAEKDIDGDGKEDKLIPSGIIWMQGESDAYSEAASEDYFENLTDLMNDISFIFGIKKLPIVICRIEDSGKTPEERMMPYIETVWKAQEKFAKTNDHVELIKLKQPIEFLDDKWHYKSKHYIEMGNSFAEKMK